MLRLPRDVYLDLVAHAVDDAPLECCGLLSGRHGDPEGVVAAYHRCANAAASARVYTVDPRDHLRADRAASGAGLDLVGVVHSHTHTPPYPSATDIAAATDPAWHYVIVSLALGEPSLRSYRIEDGAVTEERVELIDD